MDQFTPMLPVLTDEELSPRAQAVFDDIRATRNTDFVNNFWRVLANDPANLERTWAELKELMGPGTSLDPLVKELIYVAVSTVNGCTYCVRSHTAAARAKGASDEQIAELHAIVGAASKTNRMAVGLQVPVDEAFQ
ncbi:carboxymuconolactone decarboxylase family protein [Tessaracoccus caeni]|uniref:carboxymuconolactone decarboxylase family protein n=1 Tax=Tessaracoccus caeni TaxID=3031239 RepID=UPI0023DB6ACE|nr:carboxymuconolactone decarboxylase family protein [Tessaracoccus caeni]MDF1488318.1 carboxymuconolactone decarboxylase family protein [Tessaracoccus caeni]